ncbi:4-hydroxy-tetrahydrodipicolinate synthase [Bacillus velezensis]|nr:4-hydroxy-tetrahydrodipicolinate synthase [Bacillus velezensis]ATC51881.1 4-hydroxy-tetrahydrodipicolinate synthase [Bacillus velezensis]MCW5195831.1 4-hydroxy-tetrahydrodipicolinate synthase [Bacillus amyloliquefaciens]
MPVFFVCQPLHLNMLGYLKLSFLNVRQCYMILCRYSRIVLGGHSHANFIAIPTPFHEDERLYSAGFDPNVEHLKNSGIHSLLICGTTGEQHSLSMDERLQIIEYVNQRKFEDVELKFGVSAVRTSDAVKLMKHIEKTNIDSVRIGFPPYIRPTQQQAVYYIIHSSIDFILFHLIT